MSNVSIRSTENAASASENDTAIELGPRSAVPNVLPFKRADSSQSRTDHNEQGNKRSESGTKHAKAAGAAPAESYPDPDELWHDESGEPWITVGAEHIPVASPEFRTWLAGALYKRDGKPASKKKLEELCDVLAARARFDGPEHRVHLRTAWRDGVLWIDLADSDHRAVRVSAEGWEVVLADKVPVKFHRPSHMRALPIPSRDDADATHLRELLSLKDDDTLRLLLTWLSFALLEGKSYPVLAVSGPQGSAKSSFSRIVRNTIDPNAVPLLGVPTIRDLAAVAKNNPVVVFDNLSYIPPSLADAMCRLATGGGFGGRKLYTDDGEATFTAARPMILNGINDLATRGDLADRALVIHRDPITPAERREDSEVSEAFAEFHPAIFAGLLDIIVTGLRRLPEVQRRKMDLPRMADFARWGYAIAPAVGWSEDDFRVAYRKNTRSALEAAAEDDPVVGRICEVLQCCGGVISGTPEQVWGTLKGEQRERPKDFPPSPAALGRALTRAAPLLAQRGIVVERPRRTNALGRQTIIRRAP